MSDERAEPSPHPARRRRGWDALRRAAGRLRLARKRLPPSRTRALIAAVLLALFVFLHLRADDADAQRYTAVLAQLASVKLVDARWDIAVLRSRSIASTERVVQPRDVAAIQHALEAAYSGARSNALRSSIEELRRAYEEKADLVTRYQQASADSSSALAAAMRADAAVGTLIRNAWRDFPQRERLVAAENLVARVLAEAQQYQHSPSAASRAALEAAAVDLPRAHSLPRPVESALARLESDVHQLLLLKPLEQMLGDRLTVLSTATRIDELAETYQRQLTDALRTRGRYRTALLVYTVLLLALSAAVARRMYRRYALLKALAERGAPPPSAAEIEDAELVATRPAGDSRDGEPPNVRFMRRP